MDNMRLIAELREKADALEREQKKFDAMPEEQKLADIIHGRTCRYNHEDQCSYHYENWSKPGSSKKEYLEKVRAVLSITTYDIAVKVINNI